MMSDCVNLPPFTAIFIARRGVFYTQAPSGKGAPVNEIIIIQQDNKKYLFEITGKVYKHFGVEHVYAIAVYYTGHIIYNLDFDAKHEEKIILTK